MLKCIFVASVTAIAVEPGVYSPSLGNWRFYGGFGSLQSKLHLSLEAVSWWDVIRLPNLVSVFSMTYFRGITTMTKDFGVENNLYNLLEPSTLGNLKGALHCTYITVRIKFALGYFRWSNASLWRLWSVDESTDKTTFWSWRNVPARELWRQRIETTIEKNAR